ncbi:MAG: DUF6114 domain-containing protein [Pseudonocardiaceae bacterium]
MRERRGSAWRVFGTWRRTRPFTAGVFGLIAAVAIAVPPVMSLRLGEIVITISTLGGVSSAVISVIIASCAIGLWVRPELHTPCGVLTMVVSLISLVTANLGGFVIGLVCGLISGALALAWAPGSESAEGPEPRDEPATDEFPVIVLPEHRTTPTGRPGSR